MIVGTNKFQSRFIERIIKPHIFEKSQEYIAQLINEMKSRHKDKRNIGRQNVNIKEGIGGLRDIEFLLLIYKAKYNLVEPLNLKLIQKILQFRQNDQKDLLNLIQYRNFLKQVRDLYRLTVSAGDILKIEYMQPVAKIMGYQQNDPDKAIEHLVKDIYGTMDQVHDTIQQLIERI
jgi:UTP:GlnB (protein PII) uridylyltransferase